jgi:hypothetical protein
VPPNILFTNRNTLRREIDPLARSLATSSREVCSRELRLKRASCVSWLARWGISPCS